MGAKLEINPDSLATKTFTMAVIGALLYIGVVFAFVIGGNRAEEKAADKPAHGAHVQGHHP